MVLQGQGDMAWAEEATPCPLPWRPPGAALETELGVGMGAGVGASLEAVVLVSKHYLHSTICKHCAASAHVYQSAKCPATRTVSGYCAANIQNCVGVTDCDPPPPFRYSVQSKLRLQLKLQC